MPNNNTQQNDYWPCLTKLNPQPPSESLFLAKILFQPATPHSFSWSQRSESEASLRASPRLVFFLRGGGGRVLVAASATLWRRAAMIESTTSWLVLLLLLSRLPESSVTSAQKMSSALYGKTPWRYKLYTNHLKACWIRNGLYYYLTITIQQKGVG